MSFDLGDLNPVRILAGKGSIGQSGLGSLLGTVALDAAFPGLSALETAAIVGGGTALASGSIQKGLLAGIGAYGTSYLYSGLTGAGAVSNATDVIANANAEAAAQGLDSDATAKYVQDAVSKALPNGVQVGANAATGLGSLSNAGAGLSATMNNPSALANQMGGYGSVAKNALAALSPVLAAGVNTNTPMPSTTSPTAMIRPYRYSMGRYTALNPVQADKFQGFASGGVAHFDDGGDTTAAAAPAYTNQQIADYVNSNNLSGAALTAAEQQYGVSDAQVQAALAAQNPTVASTPAANVAAAAPAYTTYSNTDLGNYFANPANAAALNTPGGLAAAEAQYHADPNAVNAYLQQNAGTLGLSAGDVYGVTQGMGLQGIYNNMDSWVAAHPNATGADITAALQSSGLNQNDVQNYFNRPNSAYGTNLTTGKAFTGAGDIYTIGQNQGFSNINNNIDQWIADHPATTTTLAQAQAAMSQYGINETDVMRATGKTSAQLYQDLKKQQQNQQNNGGGNGGTNSAASTTQTVLPTNPQTNAPAGTRNPYGNVNNPGDITFNADGSKTVTNNLPGRPYGGYSGISELTNAYTAGGGHTGYVSPTNVPTSNTGGSAQAYDYLMGKTNVNPVLNPITPTGQISKDYATSVMGLPEPDISTKQYIFDPTTKKYTSNPDYIPTNFDPTTGKQVYGMSTNQVGAYLTSNPNLSDSDWLKWMTSNNVDPQQIADAMHIPLAQVLQHIKTAQAGGSSSSSTSSSGVASSTNDSAGSGANGGVMPNALRAADGGQMYAAGGIGHLGDYSDGGRLLKGPGDGVSDSIPATIGQGRPARLADGEFVVPARIVSELGNGSTDAGARKLYAMMDRVQAARGGTVGKGRVAKNTRADRYLPA